MIPDPATLPASRQPLWRRLGPAGFLAVLATTLPVLGLIAVLGTLNRLGPWLRGHGPSGMLLYVFSYWFLGGLAIVPTNAFSALAGWAYGQVLGSALALVAHVGAAVVGYCFARLVAGDRVVRLIEEKPKWHAVYLALIGRGFWKTLGVVTLLRLPPSSPFSLTNYVMATARVPIIPYTLGTAIGLAPRATAVVVTFAGLKEFDIHNMSNNTSIIVSIVVSLGVLAIIAHIARKAIRNMTAPGGSA